MAHDRKASLRWKAKWSPGLPTEEQLLQPKILNEKNVEIFPQMGTQ